MRKGILFIISGPAGSGKGTVVKNCIIMQDSVVGKDVNLNCVIADKNVVIKDSRNLSGHETHPFSLAKGTVI